jgi:DNA-binding transcriptional MocR family regulator
MAARRLAHATSACRRDAFIVEDDYDSEFRYDREPVSVLQGIAPDRVFTLGTVSKALAPTVRLGWVIAPSALAGAVAVAHLPDSADEQTVVTEALRRSVGLYGMGPFRARRGDAPPQLVLGFGLVNERAIEAGIAAVADLLR